jgi:hypothetical protein
MAIERWRTGWRTSLKIYQSTRRHIPEDNIVHYHRRKNLLSNIHMCLKGIEYQDTDWIHLAQDRDRWWVLMNTKIKLRHS